MEMLEEELEEEEMEELPLLSRKPRTSYVHQVFTTVIVSLGAFDAGCMLGWAVPAQTSLEELQPFGNLNDLEFMGLSASLMGGFLLGSLAIDHLLKRYGTKGSLLILSVICILGWIIMVLSISYWMLAIGRVVTGFSGGGFVIIAPVYIAEIAKDSIRGRLTTLSSTMLCCGVVHTYIFGTFLSWIWLSTACGIIPILLLLGTYIYIKPGPINMKGLRIERRRSSEPTSTTSWKPFLICLTLMACQQLSGVNAVIFYANDIFQQAGSNYGANVSAIIVGATQAICTAASFLVIDRLGRKILMIVSEAGIALCCLALGVYLTLKESYSPSVDPMQPGNSTDIVANVTSSTAGTTVEPIAGFEWIPEASLIIFMIFFSFGAGPIPWLLMAELCPNGMKGMSSGTIAAFCWALGLITVATFAPLMTAVGIGPIFCGYGVLSALGCLFCVFFLPETKGKSLEQINSYFHKSSSFSNNNFLKRS